jgi:hypothetical protein
LWHLVEIDNQQIDDFSQVELRGTFPDGGPSRSGHAPPAIGVSNELPMNDTKQTAASGGAKGSAGAFRNKQ